MCIYVNTGEKRVYTSTVAPLFSRSVARPRGHRAKNPMVYTIFLGKRGKRVYTIGPERRVYTKRPQTRKKKKRRVSTVVVYTFFFLEIQCRRVVKTETKKLQKRDQQNGEKGREIKNKNYIKRDKDWDRESLVPRGRCGRKIAQPRRLAAVLAASFL